MTGPRPGSTTTWASALIGVGLAGMAALMQIFRTRQWRIAAGVPFTLDGLLFIGLIVACVVPAVRRRHDLHRMGWLVVGAGTLFFVWGALSALRHPPPTIVTSTPYEIPLSFLVTPQLHGALCMFAALFLALALGRYQRTGVVVAAGALVLVGFIAWPRLVGVNRSWRLATALGGSATIHVVFLVATAVLLGFTLTPPPATWSHRARFTRLLSWGLSFLGFVGVIATGSRAGLLCLIVWVMILGLSRARRAVTIGVIALACLWGVLLLLIPDLRHSLLTEDPLRQANAATAWSWWTQEIGTIIAGNGVGQVWPWVGFDAGLVPVPGDGMIPTPHGPVLLSPHSTVLAAAAESGLVGLVLLLVVMGLIAARGFTARRDLFTLVLSASTLATSVAFLFDTYLIKEFGISFWWWLAVFIVLTRTPVERVEGCSNPRQQQDHES